jgi:predicted HicB family RNase H-like nuclease
MARKVALTARVDPAVKKVIDELAKKDGRSAGQYVERVLLAHLASKKPTKVARGGRHD